MSSKTPSRSSEQSVDTSAVPTLRVMRLQSPALHQPIAGALDNTCLLHTTLCLPDSLDVFVGENFTAYLGVLNVSKNLPIRNLTVTAQLQTPSTRWQLPSRLDPGNQAGGVTVHPNEGVDAIVSHAIEQAGQHILRVEVGYLLDQSSKSFRKFYRFQVRDPLVISETTVRTSDASCFVAVSVEYKNDDNKDEHDSMVISNAEFVPAPGLSAELVDPHRAKAQGEHQTAVELLDGCDRLKVGSCVRYLFQIHATSDEAKLRGIAAGDVIGRAVFTWRKAMGETGTVSSASITCPPAKPVWDTNEDEGSGHFVVHRSGLSVDVAAAAAGSNASRIMTPLGSNTAINQVLPVTVEPIEPPQQMQLSMPQEIKFLVVNHAAQSMTLQLQFRLSEMTGLAVCGPSFKSLGLVRPNGGSVVVRVRFLALAAGLLRVQGCCVVDLASGREIPQPPLFEVFCVDQENSDGTL